MGRYYSRTLRLELTRERRRMERVTSPSHDSCAILDQGKTNVSPERRADVFFGWQRNVFPRLHGNRHGKILLARRESSWNTFIPCILRFPREKDCDLKLKENIGEIEMKYEKKDSNFSDSKSI